MISNYFKDNKASYGSDIASFALWFKINGKDATEILLEDVASG